MHLCDRSIPVKVILVPESLLDLTRGAGSVIYLDALPEPQFTNVLFA